MPHEIVLDMSDVHRAGRVARARQRNVKDVKRYWNTRYGAFLKDGFTDEEAEWGAEQGLHLKDPQVKSLRKHRRALVALYMKDYRYTRMKAIEMAAKDLDEKLENAGVTEKNLFYEVSP